MQKIVLVLVAIIFIILLVVSFVVINKPLTQNISDSSKNETTSFSDNTNLIEEEEEATPEIIIPYLTDEEYEEKVLNHNGKVLIDFYTDWCYYCGIFSPIIEEVSKEIDDVNFYRVNAEEELDIADSNGIIYYPTIVLYKDGVELRRYSGVLPKEDLISFINDEEWQ